MKSYLITGGDLRKRTTEAQMLLDRSGIQSFDRVDIIRGESTAKSLEPKQKQSIGIEEVKLLQKNIALKPLEGDYKAFIIHEADRLTLEAQNALLKVLEEPPVHTLFVLLAETKDTLLPTILSRCFTRELSHDSVELSSDEYDIFSTIAETFSDWNTTEALKHAEKLSKHKEEALLWITKTMTIMRKDLLVATEDKDRMKKLSRSLKRLQKAHRVIQTTNVNLRLALEYTFLNK